MSDISLYQSDAELIRETLLAHRKAIYDRATKMILPEEDYDAIKNLERVADIMTDRLAQGLHPAKP